MVEHVERLEPIFQVKALGKPEILEDVQIEVLRPLRPLGISTDRPGVWKASPLHDEYIIRRDTALGIRILEACRARRGCYDDRPRIVRSVWIPNIRPVSGRKTIAVSVKPVDDCEGCAGLE